MNRGGPHSGPSQIVTKSPTAAPSSDKSGNLPSPGIQRRLTLPAEIVESITASKSEAATTNDTADDTTDTKAKSVIKKATKRTYITVTSRDDETFVIPRTACRTWDDLLEALRDAFCEKEKSIKALNEGKFIVDSKEGVIRPKYWETLVDGLSKLYINLDSIGLRDSESESSSDDDDEEELREKGEGLSDTQYELTTRYALEYFQKERYGSTNEFLFEKKFDQPTLIEGGLYKKPTSLPILELKTEVVLASFHNYRIIDEHKKTDKVKPLDPADRIENYKLKIHSSYLLNLLRALITYSSGFAVGESDLEQGLFKEPYLDLHHYKKSLLEYKEADNKLRLRHDESFNKNCDEHIDWLAKYLYDNTGVGLKQAEEMFGKQNTPTTTFSALKLLLKPGIDVYVKEEGVLNAYVLECIEGGPNRVRNVEHIFPYFATVWNLIHDGRVIKRQSKRIELPIFDFDMSVTTLPVFPAIYHDRLDNGKRREELIARGKLYFECTKKPTFMEFTGVGRRPGWKKYQHARVVVDHRSRPWAYDALEAMNINYDLWWQPEPGDEDISYFKPGNFARVAQCECDSCAKTVKEQGGHQQMPFHGYDEIDPNDLSQHSPHKYLICSQHVFGFILKDRQYDFLDVSCLEKPRIAEDAIDQLVMDSNTKETVKALVKTYTEASVGNTKFTGDFIQGKGEGQIILLHGGPGTGKTLTAESVAEFTRRPLLSISAADLGHQPQEVERNLVDFFKNAHDWDAVVLLDEADVYLASRTPFDLQRNSIVSVFLRSLDYFQGILFLTTNRIGEFDEAFKSRIHLSIGYKDLDQDARRQIWTNLFSKLKTDGARNGFKIICSIEAKEYVKKSKKLESLQWNGREIRNAFQTATALAVYDARHRDEKEGNEKGTTIPEITDDHMEKVVEMGAAFSEYMFNTRGGLTEQQVKDLEKLRFNEEEEARQRVGRYGRSGAKK